MIKFSYTQILRIYIQIRIQLEINSTSILLYNLSLFVIDINNRVSVGDNGSQQNSIFFFVTGYLFIRNNNLDNFCKKLDNLYIKRKAKKERRVVDAAISIKIRDLEIYSYTHFINNKKARDYYNEVIENRK